MKTRLILGLCGILVLIIGCSPSEPKYTVDPMPVGEDYGPPPPGPKPSIGILEFKDKTGKGYLSRPAVDELTTLLSRSGRFRIIERDRMNDVLKEQRLANLDARRKPQPIGIEGVDLIFTGSITNFEVRRTDTRAGVLLGIAGGGKKEVYRVDIGLDGRILDTASGEVIWSDYVETHREDTAKGLHILLTGYNQEVDVLESNAGKQLRFALDKLVKKMVTDLDRRRR